MGPNVGAVFRIGEECYGWALWRVVAVEVFRHTGPAGSRADGWQEFSVKFLFITIHVYTHIYSR